MRRISQKRKDRLRATKEQRQQLVTKAGCCLYCGASPKHPHKGMPAECSTLACHEILQGPLRDKVLDEPCALLVLCWNCNSGQFTDKTIWPHARQLALLQDRWPDHYDLPRFCWLRNPNAPHYVTQPEVDEYAESVRCSWWTGK